MGKTMKVVVVYARCMKTQHGFGIRIEEQGEDQWICNWTFPIASDAARREGYDRNTIEGRFAISIDYPGCAYCESKYIAKCGCGKISCWNGEGRILTCPWCGQQAAIDPERSIDSMSAGIDR